TAEDHAGNQATVPAFPVDERIFVLVGDQGLTPPIDPEIVYSFSSSAYSIRVGETLRPPDDPIFFQYQRRDANTWLSSPTPLDHGGFRGDFLEMGLDPEKEYRGRFSAEGATGEVSSEEFLFQPCGHPLRLTVTPLFPIPV